MVNGSAASDCRNHKDCYLKFFSNGTSSTIRRCSIQKTNKIIDSNVFWLLQKVGWYKKCAIITVAIDYENIFAFKMFAWSIFDLKERDEKDF